MINSTRHWTSRLLSVSMHSIAKWQNDPIFWQSHQPHQMYICTHCDTDNHRHVTKRNKPKCYVKTLLHYRRIARCLQLFGCRHWSLCCQLQHLDQKTTRLSQTAERRWEQNLCDFVRCSPSQTPRWDSESPSDLCPVTLGCPCHLNLHNARTWAVFRTFLLRAASFGYRRFLGSDVRRISKFFAIGMTSATATVSGCVHGVHVCNYFVFNIIIFGSLFNIPSL